MLKFAIAFCFIGLALFWVVRCGPHNALRAFVVELLSGCDSMLSWIRKVASSNRAIYCFCALYAMFAMQWEPLWALAPFIFGALVWRAYKKHTPTGTRDRLSTVPSNNSIHDPDIPVLLDLMAPQLQHTPIQPQPTVLDPIVTTPSVFLKEPTDWNQFKEPAWRRRGIDVASVLQAVVLTPVVPTDEVDVHIDLQPEVKVESPVAEAVFDSGPGSAELQGSFIYE